MKSSNLGNSAKATKTSGSRGPEKVLTFVAEGMTHAINFERDPHRKLAAINVSLCHVLEIVNRDEDKKRTVMSLSHFMVPHLIYERNLNKSIETVIKNFVAQGGVVETAEFRIYGGVKGQNSELRDNLKESIHRIAPEAKIEEPKGHEAKKNPSGPGGESIDYVFGRDGLIFRKMTLEGLASDDESKDEVSLNLKTDGRFDATKVAIHQEFLDSEFGGVRNSLESQTRKVEDDLARGKDILSSISEKIEGMRSDPKRMALMVRIIESQVEPMSLKVCDVNGLVLGGLEVASSRLDRFAVSGLETLSASKLAGGASKTSSTTTVRK